MCSIFKYGNVVGRDMENLKVYLKGYDDLVVMEKSL